MPGSVKSYQSLGEDAAGADDQADYTEEPSYAASRRHSDDFDERPPPPSPLLNRRQKSQRFADERSSLLENSDSNIRHYQTRNITSPGTPGAGPPGLKRQHSSTASVRLNKYHSRKGSVGHGFSDRLVNALIRERTNNPDLGTCDIRLETQAC